VEVASRDNDTGSSLIMTFSPASDSSARETTNSCPPGKQESAERAYTFEEVYCEEQEEIATARKLRCPESADHGLVGLAFSGGGIRSATFNLGIIQGIAEKGLLKQIDYLSTISGGGYIGSWLTAWIRRQGCARVEKTLKENGAPTSSNARFSEPQPVRFVRDFSNYLTPHTGAMSLDTWALLAIYFRNLLLNLVLLTSVSLCVLLLPLILIWGFKLVGPILERDFHFLNPLGTINNRIRILFWILTALSVGVAATTAGCGLMAFSNKQFLQGWKRRVVEQGAKFNSLGFLVALLFVTLLLGHGPARLVEHVLIWMITGAAAYLLFWTVALGPTLRARSAERAQAGSRAASADFMRHWSPFLVFTIVAGAAGGLLVYGVLELLDWIRAQMDVTAAADGALITLGPPLLMAAIVITQSLHVGLAGRSFDDARREWMARATGALMLTSLAWLALVGVAVYGPVVMHFLASSRWAHNGWGQFATWTLASGWAGTTVAGLGAGSAKSHSKIRRVLMRAAPYVFLIGLAFFLARGSDYVLGRMWWFGSTARGEVPAITRPATAEELASQIRDLGKAQSLQQIAQAYNTTEQRIATLEGNSLYELAEHHWLTVVNYSDTRLLVLFAFFAAIALILERRLDVNEFSMQLFYRNRLVRAYLGASKSKRSPHPFTGFSDSDDVALPMLSTSQVVVREEADRPIEDGVAQPQPYDGPYPLLGTALNIVHGKQLAWQSRKAASFVFTPKFCGYHFSASPEFESNGLAASGYRRTETFTGPGGPTLGTALGISGAAASPNMGYHSTAAISALMTICNVRMGWWVGNPRHPQAWKHKGPNSALSALLNELSANTNDEGRYVYLSDGGHFENLGLYELVRRRCRYIIACDGAQDHEMTFCDLGDAIEKCRHDFGAEIDLDVSRLKPQPSSRISLSHYALGSIAYHDGSSGEILYIKASLTGTEPLDVTAYASANQAFPHDSTANQFFNESQFESYRALGQHIIRRLTADAGIPEGDEIHVSRLFEALRSKSRVAKTAGR
jgi:hypothetical protein